MGPPALSQDSLREAVRAAGIDVLPVHSETTPSTNSDALALAEGGAPEWTVVASDHQTQGRGRLGRSWITPPGKALTFSIILRPPIAPDRAPLVSLLAAAEMAGACRAASGVEAATKWPNDLVVGDRKVGGVLAEARVEAGALRHLVLGIGVNVSTTPGDFPEEFRARATSLAMEGGEGRHPALLTAFLSGFRRDYRPERPGFPDLVTAVYRRASATLGRRVRARTVAGGRIVGMALDVDDRGGLVVGSGPRRATVAYGEVEHLDAGP